MAELKTKKNDASVEAYLKGIEPERKQQDSFTILEMMRSITGEEPIMWGSSIIGFGDLRYENRSGGGNWFVTGFAPRKQSLTLYIMPGFSRYEELLEKLGKYKIGKACLYINKLEDVDQDVLRELVSQSVEHIQQI